MRGNAPRVRWHAPGRWGGIGGVVEGVAVSWSVASQTYIIRQLDDYRFEGSLRDDLRRVAASGRALHEPSVPCADCNSIPYTRSDSDASGQTEENLAGRRPVTFAAPAVWQLEQNEP